MHAPEPPTSFFWHVADATFAEVASAGAPVERGTMMGFPCLRTEGRFFASVEPRTGALIVKLPAERVETMIEGGAGRPFAPAGRRFREWVLVEERDAVAWQRLLREALAFAGGAG